jgi:glycosyltransferase involved in cell wall biosynthesis
MRVLLLLPYAWDTSPSQRFRIEQWCPQLTAQGIEFQTATLLTPAQQRLLYHGGRATRKAFMLAGCLVRRAAQLRDLRGFDLVWLHRAAFPVGPPVLERLLAKSGVPLVYEFDDAIFLTHTTAANTCWAGLKCAGKTAEICGLSQHVVVGNEYLARYACRYNPRVSIIPTSIDTDRYQSRDRYSDSSPVVIGWTGSRSTVAYLRMLDSALQRVGRRARVRLHVIGTDEYALPGVDTYAAAWRSETELPELTRFDIGVMPMPDEEWARGKCALKALQYMGLGIPTISSPVGVNGEIIQHGANGCLAATEDEWVEQLLALVSNVRLRERLGRAGRETVEASFSAHVQAPRALDILRHTCRSEIIPSLSIT